MTNSEPSSRVAVWRNQWLPASETFIRNQLRHTTRWQPVPVGLEKVPGLDVDDAVTPFSGSAVRRAAGRLSGLTGFRHVFDEALHEVRVIHAHFGPDAVTALPLVRRLGVPLVVTFHGFDVTSAPSRTGARGRRYRAGLREVFATATILIAVSEFIAGRLAALGAPAEKIRVAHIGIPVEGASRTSGERRGIVFVGRLTAKKGVDDLLRAVAALPSDLSKDEPVKIVGFGPEEGRLRALAARLDRNVEFLGRQDSSAISRVLGESRIFCAPSRTAPDGDAEGFGLVFLEAALAGLPVVSYRHGGVPEAVVDGVTGLLAPEGDVVGLTTALHILAEDPELGHSLGEAGRRRVISDFDVTRCTERLESIYDEVSDLRHARTARNLSQAPAGQIEHSEPGR